MVYKIREGGRVFVGRPENTVSVPVSSDDPEVCGFLHGTEPLSAPSRTLARQDVQKSS